MLYFQDELLQHVLEDQAAQSSLTNTVVWFISRERDSMCTILILHSLCLFSYTPVKLSPSIHNTSLEWAVAAGEVGSREKDNLV